jgi:hypothetical protein
MLPINNFPRQVACAIRLDNAVASSDKWLPILELAKGGSILSVDIHAKGGKIYADEKGQAGFRLRSSTGDASSVGGIRCFKDTISTPLTVSTSSDPTLVLIRVSFHTTRPGASSNLSAETQSQQSVPEFHQSLAAGPTTFAVQGICIHAHARVAI